MKYAVTLRSPHANQSIEAIMKARILVGTVIAVSLLSVASAQAQPRGEHREREWHGGDMRHFHDRDFGRWRGGHWYRGHYGGRLGWWWIVGGVYYWYPQPIYPYPDPYVPPVVVRPPVVVAPQPAPPPQAAPRQPANTWYYCESAKGYYPYVPECPGGWRPVPATPPR
jgi:hypothetical protein